MVKILDRYMIKEVGPPFALAVGVLTFFLVIDRVYQLTDLVITKSVPFHLVLGLLVYMLPGVLALTVPMALLVAVLLAGGRLAGDLEIAAWKASGVSPLRIFAPFFVVALAVSAVVAVLTLVVAPASSGAFQTQLFRILQTKATTGIKERTFSASFSQMVMYVDDISASQVALRGLLVSDERDPRLSRIIVAREGRLFSDAKARRVTMRFIDGTISETDAGDARRFRLTGFTLYDLNLPLDNPQRAAERIEKPEKEMSLRTLRETIADLRRQNQIVTPLQIEMHKRFSLPVAAIVFVLVSFPLGIRTHRGGRTLALGSSLAIVVAYYVMHTFLEGMGLRGSLPVAVAMWLPNAIFALTGLALLRAVTEGLPLSLGRLVWRLWAAAQRAVRKLVPKRDPAERTRTAVGRARGPRASTYIIDRYLVSQYLTFIAIGLGVASVLILVVDLIQYLDRFLRTKPPFLYILQHLFYRLPGSLYDGLPIIVLISTVLLFLTLTQQRELDALKAAGISLYRASLPILLVAFSISVLSGLLQETVLPGLNARAEEVDRVKIRGNQPRHLQRQTQIWYRSSDTRFLRMELLDPIERSLEGLLVLDINSRFRLVDRLDANKAQWTEGGWMLRDGVIRQVGANNRVTMDVFSQRLVAMPEQINDLIQVQKAPETMSFRELRLYVTRLAETGHHVGKYLVQLDSKLSFPLVHVIMALVAIPFALVSPRGGGRGVGIAVAILISVGYWVVHSVAIAFAKAELLPPMLGAWTANIVFAGIGATLFLRART
ncbi:MAG TPA: LPS export ABC transporter permease LptG [Candidatus Bathyarchaeia archaeon]|nr:LPS export ABC transporter permease LptG [Candidatus Bathyarchaeia archaeon]